MVILCILLAYYWFFVNKVKEGLISARSEYITDTFGRNDIPEITKIVIKDGNELLNLSNLTIYDMNNNKINYTAGQNRLYNMKGIGGFMVPNPNRHALRFLFINSPGVVYNINTPSNNFFLSNGPNDTLTIELNPGIKIKSIWITNAYPSLRIQAYNLYLYNGNNLIAKYPLNSLAEPINRYSVNYIVSGPIGPAGPTGPRGFTGATGPRGFAGLAGAAGPTGPAGIAGPAGERGHTGPRGDNGMNGQNSSGFSGPSGISKANEYSYFGASSIQTIEQFSIMESLSEPMSCLSSPAFYV